MTAYTSQFYAGQSGGSYGSAKIVVPLLREMIQVNSVCDVGCGAGTWLRAWSEAGVEDYAGFDGAYALPSLQIPRERFISADLNKPLEIARRFDLATSLEVAEHLLPARSESFVADLVRLAPIVVFSAAVPHQGGTEHINERWQSEWAELFGQHGYQACDVLRPQIWHDRRIEPWYRQNAIIYATPEAISDHPALGRMEKFPLSIVHPDQFTGNLDLDSFSSIMRVLYWKMRRTLRNSRGVFGPSRGGT